MTTIIQIRENQNQKLERKDHRRPGGTAPGATGTPPRAAGGEYKQTPYPLLKHSKFSPIWAPTGKFTVDPQNRRGPTRGGLGGAPGLCLEP